MEKPSTARIALKWGLIIAIIHIIYTTFVNLFELWKMPKSSLLLGFLILIIGIVFSITEFKKSNKGFIEFGEGFGLGTLISTIVGIIISAFSLIYSRFIDTTLQQKVQDFNIEQMQQQGLSDEKIEQALEIGAKFSTPGITFIFGIILYLVVGALASLVISAIMRKSKPVFDV